MEDKLKRVTTTTGAETFIKTGEARSATVYQSSLSRYFIGRTDIFPVPAGHEGIVIFQNPTTSQRRLFFKIVTISATQSRRYFFLFDTVVSIPLITSRIMANAHRGAPNTPKALIQFGTAEQVFVPEPDELFERLIPGGQTVEIDQDGKFILEPGHNHAIKFESTTAPDQLDFAFGWWEEPLRRRKRTV